MSMLTKLLGLIDSDDTLSVVPTNLWWQIRFSHISGRVVSIRYNSSDIDYWFKGVDGKIPRGTQNMLKYNESELISYLKLG
jgi:hypothetical protein